MLAFEKHLSKLADFCGFRENGERGLDPMKELKKAMAQETGGAVPLSDCLLYDYFDDETNIAFNKGSLGFFMEVNALVGSDTSIEKNLTLFFNDELPAGGCLQFIVIASHNIEPVLTRWEEGRKYGGEELERVTYYRRHFIENLSRDYANAQDGRLARNFRLFVSYSIADKGDATLDKTLNFKRKLHNKLKAENFSPRLCSANELIDIASEILQMSLSKKDSAKYDILNDISSQILKNNDSTVCEDKIIHNDSGLVSKVLSPTELPSGFSLVEMINLLGDEYKAIPGRFIICYSLANDIGTKGKSTILARGDRVINASSKAYTKDDLLAKEEASKWIQVKAISKKGEIFLRESMLVMVTAPSADIETAEEVIKSLYNAHDWKLAVCDKIQRIASLSMLPMMASSYLWMLNFFKLTRYALSGDVVAKLPLQGEWKGVPTSGVILMGRRGQLFLFDPFHRVGGGGNYNVIIMAPPGSGKSFLSLALIEAMLTKNVAVFVMDIGGSYKNIAHLLGRQSEMVSFNKDSNISLNPFSGLSGSGAIFVKALEMLQQGKKTSEISEITGLLEEQIEALKIGKSNIKEDIKEKDGIEILEVPAKEGKQKHFVTKDSIIYAKSMVSAMCGVSGDGRSEALIERAIMLGISEHGDKLDITKMAGVLSNLKNRKGESVEGASAMADSIYSYTEEGMHARFFRSGQKDATFKEMLTVFELEELVDDEPLLAVVLQVVLMQITMQFLCGDRTRRFMLVVDEAWMILDYAASFLERFARTVRKYGGSLVVCTQDLSSFDNKCGTRKSQAAVLECSTWKLIMAQKEEGLEAFAASKAYEKYIDLIGSVRKCSSNKFSEVLISTNGVNVVGRLAVDPYSTALFSTEDKDFTFLLKKEKEGVSKHEAIIDLSRKYGVLPELPKEMKLQNNEAQHD
jgi:conjugal transfer ATP-binding protein TraC